MNAEATHDNFATERQPVPQSAERDVDLLETTSCPVCGVEACQPVTDDLPDTDDYGGLLVEPYKSLRFRFVACGGCSTNFLVPRVKQAFIHHYYKGDYHCYRSFNQRGSIFRFLSRQLAKRNIAQIEKLFPADCRVYLDYGCGSGTWFEIFKDNGVDWRLIGTDIMPEAIDLVRGMGIESHVADESNIREVVPESSVGVVNMFHVIEHVPDPVETLRTLRSLLKPGGYIIGQTPNIDSWDFRIFRQYWSQLHIPRHLVLFTPETLSRCAELAGLEVISVRSSLATSTNWAGSVIKKSMVQRFGKVEPASHSLYPPLMLAFLPLVMLQSMLSTTGSMDFTFRRP